MREARSPRVFDMEIGITEVGGILTKSNLPIAGYSVNPYVGCPHACRYCYACFMKRFTGHTEAWGEFIDVKFWKPVAHPEKYRGKTVIVGSVTDPYNPEEEKFRRTRAFLEEMKGSGIKLIITTKSDLVLRDLDVICEYDAPMVCLSVNTLDEAFRADMDRAVSIERRIDALRKCHEAGIRTTCFISPIFPGITDVFAIMDRVGGCSDYIWLENLNLRGNFKADIMGYIAEKHPDLLPLYRDIYDGRNRAYWHILDAKAAEYAERTGSRYVTNEEPFLGETPGKPVIINYFYHSEIKQSAKHPRR